jgi:hypothetical protein
MGERSTRRHTRFQPVGPESPARRKGPPRARVEHEPHPTGDGREVGASVTGTSTVGIATRRRRCVSLGPRRPARAWRPAASRAASNSDDARELATGSRQPAWSSDAGRRPREATRRRRFGFELPRSSRHAVVGEPRAHLPGLRLFTFPRASRPTHGSGRPRAPRAGRELACRERTRGAAGGADVAVPGSLLRAGSRTPATRWVDFAAAAAKRRRGFHWRRAWRVIVHEAPPVVTRAAWRASSLATVGMTRPSPSLHDLSAPWQARAALPWSRWQHFGDGAVWREASASPRRLDEPPVDHRGAEDVSEAWFCIDVCAKLDDPSLFFSTCIQRDGACPEPHASVVLVRGEARLV